MVEDAVNMDIAPRPSRIGSVEPGESLRDSLSIEIMPPLKGQGAGTLVELLDGLACWRPRFVSVTYHQAEKIDVQTSTGDVRRGGRRAGIEHAVAQARELHQSGVPGIHLFTMNDLDTTKRVVSGL